MKIRFGIGLGADTGPEQLASIVDHLEATGVDSLWFSELVYSKAVDPFVGMAYALARTTNLKVGTSVAVLPGPAPRAGGETAGVAGRSGPQTGPPGVRPAVGDSGGTRDLRAYPMGSAPPSSTNHCSC